MIRNIASCIRRAPCGKSRFMSTDSVNSAAHKLAQEALAQKTGGKSKVTLPKSDKKPSKATGEGDQQWKTLALAGGIVTGSVFGGLFYFGRPFGDSRDDKYVSENHLSAAYHRCKERYTEFEQNLHKPIWDKLLPDPLPEPYQRPYTLIVNLDDTLVHSSWDREHGWRHAKRPGVDYFLAYLSQFYEIVIFTSQSHVNATEILNKLDPYMYAMYRLFRESTRYEDGKYIKDLSHLNRDLNKVIIMDTKPEAFSKQPENGIELKPWTGEAGDHGLLEYIPFLEAVALMNPDDVRVVLKSFEGKYIPVEWAQREKEMNRIHRLQWEEEQSSKKKKRNLGSLLGSGAQGDEGPPPTLLEQMRQHARKVFSEEHEKMRDQQEAIMKQDMELQIQKLKESKLTVWDLMQQMSTGQPLTPDQLPPSQDQGTPKTSQ